MLIKEFIENFEDDFPLATQEPWDNSGIQIGDDNQVLREVYISLDCDIFHIKEAIKSKCNLIICHHPLFFDEIKSLTKDSFYYKAIELAIKNHITIYANHTPFDKSRYGMKKTPLLRMARNINYNFYQEEDGYGVMAEIEPSSIVLVMMEIIKELSPYPNLEFIRTYKVNDRPIEKVAYIGGSGADFINTVKEAGADLFITGDIKYHDAELAHRLDLNLIDLGHDLSELHFVDIVSKFCQGISVEYESSYETFRSMNLKKL